VLLNFGRTRASNLEAIMVDAYPEADVLPKNHPVKSGLLEVVNEV
jgi:hypothetical protein